MKRAIHLLVVDPQNDFCDLPEAYRPVDPANGGRLAPALPVAGAHADLQRVAALVRDGGAAIDAITITLDSHHRLHIAHPGFWQTRDGGEVAPLTPITAAGAHAGGYRPRDPQALPRALAYLDQLEARGRYTLMVWPVHCEIGSWGHNVHPDLRAAYGRWEMQGPRIVEKVMKGSNPWSEHYSAIEAEVPDAADPGTQRNDGLLRRLSEADLLLVAGEASSHCVKATAEDVAAHVPPERIVLLADCMSPVAGFEAQHRGFLDGMRARGARTATAAEMLDELRRAA